MSESSHLKEIWANAFERWIIDGDTILLCPRGIPIVSNRLPLPSVLHHNNVIFEFTAWNPLGQPVSNEQNIVQLNLLEHDICTLADFYKPIMWWKATGFSEHWREDGFALAYPATRAEYGKQIVIELAKKYNQGGVYMYTSIPALTSTTTTTTNGDNDNNIDIVLRKVLPVKLSNVESDTEMIRCEPGEILHHFNLVG